MRMSLFTDSIGHATNTPAAGPCLSDGGLTRLHGYDKGILYEVLRVATHPKVFRKPLSVGAVWEFLESVIASPGFTLLAENPRHSEVLRSTLEEFDDLRGNLLHDTRTAITMREHGIRRIYTRDTDFHRFPFLEVLDPLRVSA